MNNNTTEAVTVELNNELVFEWPTKSLMDDYGTLRNIFNVVTHERLTIV